MAICKFASVVLRNARISRDESQLGAPFCGFIAELTNSVHEAELPSVRKGSTVAQQV
jgi:hypothetical protein